MMSINVYRSSAGWLCLLACLHNVALMTNASGTDGGSLPALYISGTHYQIGFQTGQTYKDYIQTYYGEHPMLRPVWLPWSRTSQGQKVVNGFLTAAKTYYPGYVGELVGMSKGANVSFIEMFLANHAVEISALLSNSTYHSPDSCTDLLVNKPDKGGVVLAHNEDNSPLIQNKTYMLTATVIQDGEVREQFTAYCYPGQLAGNAFGFNYHGVITTMNGLYPKYVRTDGVGRSFINRAMLVSSGISDMVRIAHTPAAYGFSSNIGILSRDKTTRPQLYNIETAPDPINKDARVSVEQVLPSDGKSASRVLTSGDQNVGNYDGYYFHVNIYRRLDVSQLPDHMISSVHRQSTINSYPSPTDAYETLEILGDESDKVYPIYRSPRPTDNETTLATALFDLERCTMTVYTDNPHGVSLPLLVLPLPC